MPRVLPARTALVVPVVAAVSVVDLGCRYRTQYRFTRRHSSRRPATVRLHRLDRFPVDRRRSRCMIAVAAQGTAVVVGLDGGVDRRMQAMPQESRIVTREHKSGFNLW